MSAFKKEQFVPVIAQDLPSAGQEIARHFQQQGYSVEVEPSVVGATVVSLHKLGIFRAVLGLKTALKINLEPVNGGTMVRAEIGMWGHQVAPTAIMLLVAWPVLLTQIWGFVQQSKLDDEAVRIAAETLHKMAGAPLAGTTIASAAKHCVECGQLLSQVGKFCPSCGKPIPS
jgi:hypothetical protein